MCARYVAVVAEKVMGVVCGQAELDHMCTQREIDASQHLSQPSVNVIFFLLMSVKKADFLPVPMLSRLIGASIWNINAAAAARKHNVLFVSLFTHCFLFFNNTGCCKSLSLYH